MVQSIIDLSEAKDRILNIVKAQHGLKNKSQAMEFVLGIHADSFLEPELRPEYVERLMKISKGPHTKTLSSMREFEEHFEKNV